MTATVSLFVVKVLLMVIESRMILWLCVTSSSALTATVSLFVVKVLLMIDGTWMILWLRVTSSGYVHT